VHFDWHLEKGKPRIGRSCVLTINDLAQVLTGSMQDSTCDQTLKLLHSLE